MSQPEKQRAGAKPLPPMLQLYREYKQRYPDALLFFQVGDFYELFFEDAVQVAELLELTLTSRDKNSPDPIPMCGVPLGVVDTYASRLLAHGLSVAIVSQFEDKSQKGGIGRKLERILTPGVRILDHSAEHGIESILATVALNPHGEAAISFSDVQSGVIWVVDELREETLPRELLKVAPTELLLPKVVEGKALTRRSAWVRRLEQLAAGTSVVSFQNYTVGPGATERRELAALPGFTASSVLARQAVRMLVNYVDHSTVEAHVQFSAIRRHVEWEVMSIDATTRANLELLRNSKDGQKRGTLFSVLDRSLTPGGTRLLQRWITAPLIQVDLIQSRQILVQFLLEQLQLREQARSQLRAISDIERLATRCELGVISPREMAALRDSLRAALELRKLAQQVDLKTFSIKSLSNVLVEAWQAFGDLLNVPVDLLEKLSHALEDSPSVSLNSGGVIRAGYSSELDRVLDIKKHGKSWIAALEAEEREKTGISSLKVKFNKVFGYFIEVTKSNLDKVPESYLRKQTIANGERYITPELKEREEEVLGAESKQLAIERELFEALRKDTLAFTSEIKAIAGALSEFDVLLGFAELAEREQLVRPEVTESSDFEIIAGRHPVLMQSLRSEFVPNSLRFGTDSERCVVLTGPNMGGKSTYLRQAALIAVMAQLGSFVPAESAKIGIVDKVFARIGASDDIHEGESTFMVEMREASNIIRTASKNSLVLIDEIGRGTATADGLVLAHAILEWIIDEIGCRTLFATHFHELTLLAEQSASVVNLSVGSVEHEGQVLFTHKICEGPANRSYGLEVARLAGLPIALVKRAARLLAALDEEQRLARSESTQDTRQLSLFAAALTTDSKQAAQESAVPEDYEKLSKLKERLDYTDLDETSPRAALELLYELRGM